MKIKSKLFIIMVSLVIVSLLVGSIVSINSFSTGMISEIKKHLEDNTAQTMDKVSKMMFDRISDIKLLSGRNNTILGEPNSTVGKQQGYLKAILRNVDNIYDFASIYDKRGIKIADSSNNGIGSNDTQKAFFKNTIRGNIYYDQIPVQLNGDYIIRVAGPLYGYNGNVDRVLVLGFPFNKIGQSIQAGAISSNIKINLVSNDGLIIYSNYDNNNNSTSQKSFGNQPIFGRIKNSSHSIESIISTDINGQGDAIFVAAKDKGYLDYPGNGWFLIMAQSTEQAFNQVLKLRNGLIIATVLVLSVATIAVFFLARTISKPIIKLKKAAEQISEGKLDLKIRTDADDEIGELARQLDKMRESIQITNKDLHLQTKELEKANKDLTIKQEELEKAYGNLKQSEKAKEEFLSMISHELKTPLVPMRIYSDMLLNTKSLGELNAMQMKAIQTIHRNLEKQEALVNDVLDVYKLEMNKLHFSKVDVDIVNLSDLKPLTIDKQIDLRSDIKITGTLYCDPGRTEQVLSNLIKNSIDFVPAKDGMIIVRVESGDDAKVVFTVEDNGIGIPPDEAEKLFKKFYQIDTSAVRKHGGTGLGLTICKGIVEAHGGEIWIDSSYNNGTAVKFTLQRYKTNNSSSSSSFSRSALNI
jgi:signal transduction histidine kinase